MTLNHNLIDRILLKLERPNVIYKVVHKYCDGVETDTYNRYFYEETDAHKYLRDQFIDSLTDGIGRYFQYYSHYETRLYETKRDTNA